MENNEKELPKLSKQEQDEIVKDIVERAEKSRDFFGNENDRKKDDYRVFSNVEAFSEDQKKEVGAGRLVSKVNTLPLYVNAVTNLFLENPFQVDAETDSVEVVTDMEGNEIGNSKEFVNKKLSEILEASDANENVFGPGLNDLSICGGAIFFNTIEKGEIKVNLAYDPTSAIIDPNSKTIDGSDSEYFGIVESISYESANEMAEGTLPSKDRIKDTKTYNFGGFNSPSPDSLNLVHFFLKKGGDVYYYKIVGDIVIYYDIFEGLSCLPIAIVHGQLFRDNEKKLYKGVVRDVKDLCKIVNGGYTVLWERIREAQDPFWLLDQGGVEGSVEDYNNSTTPYKRFRSQKEIREGVVVSYAKPERVVPEIVTADIMPQINDALLKISKIIGVPDDGIGFVNGTVQQTAAEFLGKSTAMVNNVSHFYRHLSASIKHICKVIVEMICIYNGIKNDFVLKVTKGPADALRRERVRQQLSAILQLCPEAVKPLVLAEIVKLMDVPGADKIAAAILLALPPEIKQAMNEQGGEQLEQLMAPLKEQLSALMNENEELKKQIQSEVISNQAQIIMARENNEAALRSKLVELEAKAAENEKDRALELAKLDASQQATFLDAANKSKEMDIKAHATAAKELEVATKLRAEAEAKRAEFISRVALAPMVPVVAQQPEVM